MSNELLDILKIKIIEQIKTMIHTELQNILGNQYKETKNRIDDTINKYISSLVNSINKNSLIDQIYEEQIYHYLYAKYVLEQYPIMLKNYTNKRTNYNNKQNNRELLIQMHKTLTDMYPLYEKIEKDPTYLQTLYDNIALNIDTKIQPIIIRLVKLINQKIKNGRKLPVDFDVKVMLFIHGYFKLYIKLMSESNALKSNTYCHNLPTDIPSFNNIKRNAKIKKIISIGAIKMHGLQKPSNTSTNSGKTEKYCVDVNLSTNTSTGAGKRKKRTTTKSKKGKKVSKK